MAPSLSASRRTLIRTMFEAATGPAVCTIVVTAIASVMPTVFVVASGALVGAIAHAAGAGIGSPAAHDVIRWLAVVGVVLLLQQTLPAIRGVFAGTLARRVMNHTQERVATATSAPVGIAHLEDPEFLDVVSLAQGIGPGSVGPGQAVSGVVDQWGRRVQGVTSILVVAVFRWWLAVLLLATEISSLRLYLRAYLTYAQAVSGQAQELRRSDYMRNLGLERFAAKETRIFGLSGWLQDRFAQHWRVAMTDLWRRRRRDGLLQAVPLITEPAAYLVALIALGDAATHGHLSLGRLVTFSQAVVGAAAYAYLSPGDLMVAFGADSAASVGRVERTLADSTALHLGGDEPAGDRPARRIHFEQVSFTYPGQTTPVFDRLDLVVNARESLAIVGANGAGKTTLVKLLCRLYDPDAGRVTVDGTDLRTLDPVSWRHRIGAIFQDFTQYELSVLDNVAFGAVRHTRSDEDLREAARRAGALEFLDDLPGGWSTPLSRQYEGGADLSGGQWQRVALARAVYATLGGATVLILDEPTANLDVRAEADLYERFLEITHGLTTVVISHRFSTVRHADRIVVIDAGRIVEDGTHDTLLERRGLYAEMFALQAARFTDADDEMIG